MIQHTITPEQVFREYEEGAAFKAALGRRGLYEQNRINERFFAGDQWRGANCGDQRPLVRYNIIKRIGEYKMAVVGSAPVAVRYTAEGVAAPASTTALRDRVAGQPDGWHGTLQEPEVAAVMTALSEYFQVTAARVGLEEMKETVLRNAYQTGTGLLYAYWDDRIPTGLYADHARTVPIRGDIACEALDVENVYFGDPTNDEVQTQPYILIAQRQPVGELRRQARQYGCTAVQAARIRPDDERQYMAGDPDRREPESTRKATVLTRFWKEWDEQRRAYTVKAVKTCRGQVVRPVWDLGIRRYPLAKSCWERRKGCAYGDSEITYLIPNQIAINRMMTASVWAVMMMGMPMMVVNGDLVNQPLTNDPGQIIPVYGSADEVEKAIHYVKPPDFSPQFDDLCASLIVNTLNQAGVNSAVLGDMTPDNTSAIIAVREAAMMPLNMIGQRFYRFVEEVARLFAEFWVTQYGRRRLRMEDERGVWYLPFDGTRYRDLILNVRVQAGASSLWSENQSVQTLDNLFDRQMIDKKQYLERLPKGAIPDLERLLRECEQPTDTKGGENDAATRNQRDAGGGKSRADRTGGASGDAAGNE